MGIHQWNIQTIDFHTAGERFRVVPDLPFEICGSTVLERRQSAMAGVKWTPSFGQPGGLVKS
jgi:proline racemase